MTMDWKRNTELNSRKSNSDQWLLLTARCTLIATKRSFYKQVLKEEEETSGGVALHPVPRQTGAGRAQMAHIFVGGAVEAILALQEKLYTWLLYPLPTQRMDHPSIPCRAAAKEASSVWKKLVN